MNIIKHLALIIVAIALLLAGYGFFIAQRAVGWLYVFPALVLLLLAAVLFLIEYLMKRRQSK
jgi:hypothetical protein